MKLSHKTKYGLKALIHIATFQGPCNAVEIAAGTQIPSNFLRFILLELTKADILTSLRGKGGGYELARPAANILVGQVIRVLDGSFAPIDCANRAGATRCDDCPADQSCVLQNLMSDVHELTSLIIDRTSIADLSSRVDYQIANVY